MLANPVLLWGENPLSGGGIPKAIFGDALSAWVGDRQSARFRSCGDPNAEGCLSL